MKLPESLKGKTIKDLSEEAINWQDSISGEIIKEIETISPILVGD